MKIIDILIIFLIIVLVISSVFVVICKIMIHKCDKDIAKYNAELERIEAERDKNRAEIEQLKKELIDIEHGRAFVDRWRGNGLIELIGTNYNHPIWKEYNELSDEVKEMISIACRQATIIEYKGE